ncbi:hypothetical protein Sjap_025521 [Stephania japonica]|uniref:Uncharacterized protein n=1 Tax=Stephania japonica TaxID=461633 RepID=A0AAP0HJM8_9MAGN
MNKCFYNHLKVVNLSLNRLKKLEIDNMGNYLLSPCDRLVDCKLELHTLNLLTFVYKGTMFKNWSIGNLVGLIDVDLFVPPLVFSHSEWYTRFEGHWVKLFKALNGARTFTINFALLDKVEPVPPLPYTLDYLKYYYVPIEGVEELNNKFEFLGALFKNAVNLERMTITALFQQFPEFGEDAHRERIPEFRDKLMALFQQFPNLQVSLQVS